MKGQAGETERLVKLEGDPASGPGSPKTRADLGRREGRYRDYGRTGERPALRSDRWIFILAKSVGTLPKKAILAGDGKIGRGRERLRERRAG